MSTKLAALNLSLGALGLSADTGSLEDRVKLQKAVYLAQAAGLPLGYRYSWYIRGPYSPDLTRDYFALAPSSARKEEELKLSPTAQQAIDRVKPLMEVPAQAQGLKPDAWLEIVASVHYLKKESQLPHEKALETLKRQKPYLVKYIPLAEQKLAEVGLLN
jgi:uncharacterized protein YwgA